MTLLGEILNLHSGTNWGCKAFEGRRINREQCERFNVLSLFCVPF